MIHRKKNRPALQRRDILTVFFIDIFFWWGGGGGGGGRGGGGGGGICLALLSPISLWFCSLWHSIQLSSLQNTSF